MQLVFVICLCAVVLASGVGNARAQSANGSTGIATDRSFSLRFAAGSHEPLADAENGRALARIAAALQGPSPNPDLELRFVSRETVEPWLGSGRFSSGVKALTGRVSREILARNRLDKRFAYDTDFKPRIELPADEPGTEFLHLRLHAPLLEPAADCPWQISLGESHLPPTVGYFPGSTSLLTSGEMRFSVRPLITSDLAAYVVWETGDSTDRRLFAAAMPSIRTPSGEAQPAARAHLHLIAAPRDHAIVPALAALGPTSRPSPEIAAMLAPVARMASRNVGDSMQPLASDVAIGLPPVASTLIRCTLTVAPR